MVELTVLGVTHLSDFYPNVKFKIDLIKNIENISTHTIVYDLGKDGFYKNLGQRNFLKIFLGYFKIFWGTLSVCCRFLFSRTHTVYVVYPAPMIILLLSFLPKKIRPVIYMDAFISLYDTAVFDRAMMRAGSLQGRLLFWLERHAFLISKVVLVDTDENAKYYAALFEIDPSKFQAIPLSIPPLQITKQLQKRVSGKFTCLFVGSLVPLHGIKKILEAARKLAHLSDLEFVIIGDGQEAFRIEEFLRHEPTVKLRWDKGMFSTDYIISAIHNADLCLGIFGDTAKAQRVVPYKIYYYAALSKPFLTGATLCLNNNGGNSQNLFLCDSGSESPNSLANLIAMYYEDTQRLNTCAVASGLLYSESLSQDVIHRKLLQIFEKH